MTPGAEDRPYAHDRQPRATRPGGAADTWLLDTRHGGVPGTVGVYALRASGGGVVLVESGSRADLAQLERALDAAGHELAEVRAVLLTHIHLDHAGAAGEIAARSGAEVWVHPRGARHLADPERLVASARRAFGAAFDRVHGGMTPVPEDRLRTLEDGARIRVAGIEFEVLHTPGHASHHAALLRPDEASLFTGDAAAVRFAGSDLIRPALAPPEVDLEAWDASVARMRAAKPQRLLLTHFGAVEGATAADAHLARVPERNRTWAEALLEGVRRGEDHAALRRRAAALAEAELARDDAPEPVRERHRVTSDADLTAAGVARYWRRHHPERLPDGEGEASGGN